MRDSLLEASFALGLNTGGMVAFFEGVKVRLYVCS